ncbi:MAG: hypothetical protein ACK58O_12170 [Brevundimonas sp.]
MNLHRFTASASTLALALTGVLGTAGVAVAQSGPSDPDARAVAETLVWVIHI